MKHTSRAHALISPSGAERWMNCTPSAVFEQQFPGKSSTAADEGTLAHEMAEQILKHALGEISQRRLDNKMKDFRVHALYYEGMEDDVAIYTDLVLETLHGYQTSHANVEYRLETKFDLGAYVENGFGTADFSILTDTEIHIIDLKFGKGVQVSAHENKQLMLYGLGALEYFDIFGEIKTISMAIIQPRLESVSTYSMTADDLRAFGEQVREVARVANAGEGEFKSGDHCRFCKGRHRCKAFAEQQLKEAKAEFALNPEEIEAPNLHDLNMLSDEELVNINLARKNITKWLDSVNDYMVTEAEAGREWPGLHLVDGKSVRYWLSDEDAQEVLLKEGLTEDQIIKKTLQGITAVEKLLGKTRFAEVEKQVVGRKNQAKQLVKSDIKRIEKQTARDAFAE